MQMSRRVFNTSAFFVSVGKRATPIPGRSLWSAPTSCWVHTCREESIMQPSETAGFCTLLHERQWCTSDKLWAGIRGRGQKPGDPGEHSVKYRAQAETYLCRSALEKAVIDRIKGNERNQPIPSTGHPSGLLLCKKVFVGQGEEKLPREIHDFIFKKHTYMYIPEQNLEFKKAIIWHLGKACTTLIISLYDYKLWLTFMIYCFFLTSLLFSPRFSCS